MVIHYEEIASIFDIFEEPTREPITKAFGEKIIESNLNFQSGIH